MSSKQAKRRNSGSSLEAESKPSKRAKKQNDAKDDPPLEFTWEDKGTILPDGSVEHNRLEVTQGDDSMIIMVGDSILLSRQGTVRTAESDDFVARVEKMWQGLPKKRGVPAKMMVQCRWYYKVLDSVVKQRFYRFVMRFISPCFLCLLILIRPETGH